MIVHGVRDAKPGGMKPLKPSRPVGRRQTRFNIGSLFAVLALLGAGRAFAGDQSSTLTAAGSGGSLPNAYLSLGLGATEIGPMATLSLSPRDSSPYCLARSFFQTSVPRKLSGTAASISRWSA
jgi:hypothetical protein